MTLESVLMMLGGIGLFLYGMKLMGSSLERCAGARMENILEKLTNNKAKGVGLGACVTAIIQSSSATIIMVIGFLNAGIMNLVQAVPVIMGANIGTTITAQILRLGDISSDNILLVMLKPASFAPLCIVIGAFILLLSKKQRIKDRAGIVIGLGILFCGMSMMEQSFEPLTESPEFRQVFTLFENPALGVLMGAAVTIVLQSSSASVGVLQATASTGVITFAMAAPMVIGANIGKCATVLLASIGTNKNSKRAVCIDVAMCLGGAALFLVAIYIYQAVIGFGFWNETMSRGNIADFHTLFNIVTCLIMLPLCNVLIALANKVVKEDKENRMDEELKLLNDNFLSTPQVALQQCKKVIISMGQAARANFRLASGLLENFDDSQYEKLKENEKFLDKSETVLGEYIIRITENPLTETQNRFASEMMKTLSDWERIGDHCVNLAELAEYNAGLKVIFSDEGYDELEHLNDAIDEIIGTTLEAYENDNLEKAYWVEPMEDVIDDLVDLMKGNHIERLKQGRCTVEKGVSFAEMLSNIERISDHCDNIALHTRQRLTGQDLDTHVSKPREEEYRILHDRYKNIYYRPVRDDIREDYKKRDSKEV